METVTRVSQLVDRVRRGDTAAFAALHGDHYDEVERVAGDHSVDPHSAPDFANEVFARALDILRSLRRPDLFRPWLLSLARQIATDRSGGMDSAGRTGESTRRCGPADVDELRELADLAAWYVDRLPERDGRALDLFALGIQIDEVAAAVGIPRSGADALIDRTRRRLRAALALQMRVRSRGAGCAEFLALHDADETISLARHVLRCEACRAATRSKATA